MTDPLSFALNAVSLAKATDPDASAATKVGSQLWGDLLGPAARAYGTHLGRRVDEWAENQSARRVLEKAAQKTDTTKPGAVPPRVASEVFEKAQWAEDEFMAEYLSGVLASSRSDDQSDDRGVAWAALVGRLSSLSLKLHYLLYEAAGRVVCENLPERLETVIEFRIAVNYEDLWRALGLSELHNDRKVQERRMLEALSLLQREGVLHTAVRYGYVSYIAERYPETARKLRAEVEPLDGVGGILVYSISWPGVELYMWGHGLADVRPAEWMNIHHEDPALPALDFPLLADDPDPKASKVPDA